MGSWNFSNSTCDVLISKLKMQRINNQTYLDLLQK